MDENVQHAALNRPSTTHWQFSLRTLLVFATLVAVVLSLISRSPILFSMTIAGIASIVALEGAIHMMSSTGFSNRPILAMLIWCSLAFGFVIFGFASCFMIAAYFSMQSAALFGALLVPFLCALHCLVRFWRIFIE